MRPKENIYEYLNFALFGNGIRGTGSRSSIFVPAAEYLSQSRTDRYRELFDRTPNKNAVLQLNGHSDISALCESYKGHSRHLSFPRPAMDIRFGDLGVLPVLDPIVYVSFFDSSSFCNGTLIHFSCAFWN